MNEKMFLFVESDEDADDGMNFVVVPNRYRYYMSDEAVNLGETTVSFDMPQDLSADTIRAMAIQTLREKQDRIIAEAQVEKNKLEVKINELLRLTHQPEPAWGEMHEPF